MRVFVTGATGFIGTAVTRELLAAGHSVVGLARTEAGAATVAANGATPLIGSLEDLEGLQRAAAQADGVIHLAFNHDFSKFMENAAADAAAITAMGEAMAGSGNALIATSGLAGLSRPGALGTEQDEAPAVSPRQSEQAALALVAKGVRGAAVRLPQVHDNSKLGFVSHVIAVARATGVAAYLGEGQNRWAAAHLDDVARLYRLALERGEAGARWHAIGDEGVPMRTIAEAIGRGLKIPVRSISAEDAGAHFGWIAGFIGGEMSGSAAYTRQTLGWTPTGADLITELTGLDWAAI